MEEADRGQFAYGEENFEGRCLPPSLLQQTKNSLMPKMDDFVPRHADSSPIVLGGKIKSDHDNFDPRNKNSFETGHTYEGERQGPEILTA